MLRITLGILLFLLGALPAEAKRYEHARTYQAAFALFTWHQPAFEYHRATVKKAKRHSVKRAAKAKKTRPAKAAPRHHVVVASGPPAGCPARAWCGCFLSKLLGLNRRDLWLARNWAGVGTRVSGPVADAIVVWPHHVGIIKKVTGHGRAIVLSGNDGRRVRERERSLAGVIAYRVLSQRMASAE